MRNSSSPNVHLHLISRLKFLPWMICLVVIGHPFWSKADTLAPTVDLRAGLPVPLVSTWASAGGRALLKVEANAPTPLIYDSYQVEGKLTMPLGRKLPLAELKVGPNDLEIPMPEKLGHAKVLFKIANAEGKLLVNLMVSVLPEDAWESLAKASAENKVGIDSGLKAFSAWAAAHRIQSRPGSTEKPVEYYFGKLPGNLTGVKYAIYERDASEALPVVEVMTTESVTKIILPPGFLEQLPTSPTAQALLLKYLKLL